MINKYSRFLFAFLLVTIIVFQLLSCQDKTFSDYEINEIVASNRDSRVRKIDEDFYIQLGYSNSLVEVYCISSLSKKEAIGYALNSIDNILVCSGFFDQYGTYENQIYFITSMDESLTVLDKTAKQVKVISILECENFEKIVWNKV